MRNATRYKSCSGSLQTSPNGSMSLPSAGDSPAPALSVASSKSATSAIVSGPRCSQRTPIGRGYRGVNWRDCAAEATYRIVFTREDGTEVDHTEHTGPLCERHAKARAATYDRPVELRRTSATGGGG